MSTESKESSLYRWIATWTLRLRWGVLVAVLGVTVLSIYTIRAKLVVDSSTESFFAADSKAKAALDDLRDTFGNDTSFLVIVEGEVFTTNYLERLERLHHELAALDVQVVAQGGSAAKEIEARSARRDDAKERATSEDSSLKELDNAFLGTTHDGWGKESGGTLVDEIVSLINVRRTRWKDGGLEVTGLLDKLPPEAELPALSASVLGDSELTGRIVGAKGRHSVILLRTPEMTEENVGLVYDAMAKIATKHEADGFKVYLGGQPTMNTELNRAILGDMPRLTGLSLVVAFLVLVAMFRSWVAVAVPLLIVVFSLIWTFGAMAAAGAPVSMVSSILPTFLICVGIGDSVHMLSTYRELRHQGLERDDAILKMVATTGMPVFYTSVTTAAGLFSFCTAALSGVQELGIFGGFGVLAALSLSVLLLPVLLSFTKANTLGERRRYGDFGAGRLLAFCDGLSRSRRRALWTLGAAIAVTAVCSVGIARLRVHHDPLTWVSADFGVRQAVDVMDANVGGASELMLLVEARDGANLKERDTLLALEKLDKHIASYRDAEGRQLAASSVSFLDIVRESFRAVNENDPAHYRIPETQGGVNDMFTLFANAAPEDLKRVITIDDKKAVITVRTRWQEALAYVPFTEHVAKGIATLVGDKASVQMTGTVFNLVSVLAHIIKDLLSSFSITFFTICLVFFVVFRNLKLALLAIVPNLLPIVWVLSVMGFCGIPIDLSNLLVATIALGISDEDTIHFVHHFKTHYARHRDVEAALRDTSQYCGRAMVATSLVLMLGFLVYMTSDLVNLVNFGLLITLSVLFALMAELILMPALLRLAYGMRAPFNADATTTERPAQPLVVSAQQQP